MMGDKAQEMLGFLDSGAYLYDKERNELWHQDKFVDQDGTIVTKELWRMPIPYMPLIDAIVLGTAGVGATINDLLAQYDYDSWFDSPIVDEWGTFRTGGQGPDGRLFGEELVRLCQMASGNPKRWLMISAE